MAGTCRFRGRGLPVAPPRPRPAPAPPGAPAPSGGDPARREGSAPGGGADPIAALLADLRGRPVTIQVGDRLLTGRLLLADPAVLVDGSGRATFVRPEAVVAVTF